MTRRKQIVILLLFLTAQSLLPQSYIRKAKKSYNEFDYSKVIEFIGQHEELENEMLRKLAESYRMTGNYHENELVYGIITSRDDKTAEDQYNYAQALKMNSKYEEAKKEMEAYCSMRADEVRVELFLINKNYVGDLRKDQGRFAIKSLGGNSPQQDFGVTYYKNKLAFVSSRQKLEYVTRLWNGNKLPYLDIYTGKVNQKNELKGIGKFPAFNKKYHDGPCSFNKKGTLIIYTSDNYAGKSKDGVRKLKLYEGHYEKGGEWSHKENFPYNSDEYSCGHPALSPDGNTLYFVSDMPGGFGGTDIYKCLRNEKGGWGRPANLGEKINTEGNEMFPYFHESGLFFFSSDGRPGLGGLDIFVTQLTDEFICKPINAGAPANGPRDDFGMVLDAEKKKGFFSSNREGGKGSDDIYSFDLLKPFYFGKLVKGVVKNNLGQPVFEAAIYLMDKKGGIHDKVCTKKDGSYSMYVDEGKQYKLLARAEDHFDQKVNLNTSTADETIGMNITLEKDPGLSLVALVTNNKTKQPLPDVKITFTDAKGKKINASTTVSGQFQHFLTNNKIGDTLRYFVEISKTGFVTKTFNLNWVIKKPGEQKIHEKMDISMSKVEVGGDLAKMTNLQSIYFDFGKSAIRPDAATELDKIVRIMNENPDMHVELGSHTDCRSSRLYNLKLSDARAKASADYIRKRITNPARIAGKGYGESKLLNNCACEGKVPSPCAEEEHQKNRRTEFIILKAGN